MWDTVCWKNRITVKEQRMSTSPYSPGKLTTHLAKHFSKDGHNITIKPIEKVKNVSNIRKSESYWIRELKTIYPYGLPGILARMYNVKNPVGRYTDQKHL